jgi:hypothetical protein
MSCFIIEVTDPPEPSLFKMVAVCTELGTGSTNTAAILLYEAKKHDEARHTLQPMLEHNPENL